jgi:hypothetical protein
MFLVDTGAGSANTGLTISVVVAQCNRFKCVWCHVVQAGLQLVVNGRRLHSEGMVALRGLRVD